MNILQDVRDHVQLVVDDAEQEASSLNGQLVNAQVLTNFEAVYAQVQGLGKMLLAVVDELEARTQ